MDLKLVGIDRMSIILYLCGGGRERVGMINQIKRAPKSMLSSLCVLAGHTL